MKRASPIKLSRKSSSKKKKITMTSDAIKKIESDLRNKIIQWHLKKNVIEKNFAQQSKICWQLRNNTNLLIEKQYLANPGSLCNIQLKNIASNLRSRNTEFNSIKKEYETNLKQLLDEKTALDKEIKKIRKSKNQLHNSQPDITVDKKKPQKNLKKSCDTVDMPSINVKSLENTSVAFDSILITEPSESDKTVPTDTSVAVSFAFAFDLIAKPSKSVKSTLNLPCSSDELLISIEEIRSSLTHDELSKSIKQYLEIYPI